MNDVPDRAREAFEGHDAWTGGDGFRLETTTFDARLTPAEGDGQYRLTVRAPTLDAAVEEDAGPAVQDGWFETLSLRLEDAPGAVRGAVDLADLGVETVDDEVVATFTFSVGTAGRAPDVAKAIAEYVEGTYMEGVVPGYTYRGPVAEMLSRARQGEDGDSGPMPL